VVNVPYEQPTSPQYVVYQPHNGNVVYQQQQQPLMYASPVQGYPGPQVIYVQQQVQNGPYHGHATASLVLYVLSAIGILVCALPSIILSLQMVSKKVIPCKQRTSVIICGIFELIAFVICPVFVLWSGMITIFVWWAVTIACGIPRTIYTYNARNNNPEHC